MAKHQGTMMRINWVFADSYRVDPTLDLDKIKSIGPSWGSWQTWRSCATDNVICHDRQKAQELLKRAFQAVCNFHVPKRYYQDLGRPIGLHLYEGTYDQEVDHIEDIVCLNLVSGVSDLVLMCGFQFGTLKPALDRFENHKLQNYHGLCRSIMQKTPAVQWVMVDHSEDLDKAYQVLPNLTCDSMENVLQLLI